MLQLLLFVSIIRLMSRATAFHDNLLGWWVLLGDISLRTTLKCLALIMLQIPLLLLSTITSQTRDGTTDGTGNAVRDTRTQIAQLALCFLLFSSGVLFGAFLLEGLDACEVSEGFFCGTDCLVPGAVGAVWVVFGDAAGGDGDAADAGAGLGELFLGFGVVFFGLAFGLGCVSGDSYN